MPPETTTAPSADGRWELRTTNHFVLNSEGYGSGAWRIELVERATGRVVRTWTGGGTASPWESSTHGVSSVRWDGNELVVAEDDVERRVAPDAKS
jgi:hypothetical protein